jgi:5'-nucleotidase
MNRRSFIKRTGWLLAGGMMLRPLESWTKPRARQWALLNTNDFHSRFLPFPANHRRYPNQGGMARLTSVIQEYRSKYEHLALFDCGDVFQGTPYFNVFQGDPELSWMKKMGYDATTLGNHDFDKGVNHLYTLRKRHQTPTVLCNYEMSESELQEIVTPYKVIKKGPVKIGVTGLCVNLEGLIG